MRRRQTVRAQRKDCRTQLKYAEERERSRPTLRNENASGNRVILTNGRVWGSGARTQAKGGSEMFKKGDKGVKKNQRKNFRAG